MRTTLLSLALLLAGLLAGVAVGARLGRRPRGRAGPRDGRGPAGAAAGTHDPAGVDALRVLLHEYMEERESAEDELQRQTTALRASEERYRSLITRAAYGIYRTTPEGRFLEVNPALVTMTGYESAEALMAVDVGRDLYLDPAERAGYVREAERDAAPDWVATRWRRRDGTTIVVRLSARPVRDRAGRVVEFEGIVEDVTARTRQDEMLRRGERMASLGNMLAGVAHEINNPLAAISGFAQLLLRGAADDEDRAALETIGHEAARAGKIVKDLLVFARQEEHDRREPVRINDVARYIVTSQRYAMETRGIRCRLTLAQENPVVLGDSAQLEQVVLNLVVNARQAIEAVLDVPAEQAGGREDALVDVRTRVDGREVILEVRDTGSGIPETARARVFDPFFTTKGEGQGTGLGLSVVHGIVAEHGGAIDFETEPGAGTRFVVRLPRAAGEEAAAPPPRPSGERPIPLDVLLVDDEEAIIGFLTRYLTSRGHAVVSAADGAEAVRLASNMPFDVVICDLHLPDARGDELIARLRALPGAARTRIVLSTGDLAGSPARASAQAAGVDAIVEKPYEIEVLRRAVEER